MSVLVNSEFENENEQLMEPEQAAVHPVSDERANIPVSETAERFLRAVLVKVPLDRIEELHLFSPLRQGTAETGIAVIAARVIVPDEPESSDLELQLEAGAEVEVDDASDVIDDANLEASFVEPSGELTAGDDGADELISDPPAVRTPRVRHTVYTARYRLVVKGPDRGKWEMDVVDEADAPLLAVETVVRGVQRRAGEETATVRYDAAQLARALRIAPSNLP